MFPGVHKALSIAESLENVRFNFVLSFKIYTIYTLDFNFRLWACKFEITLNESMLNTKFCFMEKIIDVDGYKDPLLMILSLIEI